MAKLPTASHPLPQLTSGELLRYIGELRQSLRADLSEADRELVLGRLGKCYTEANERGLGVPEAEAPGVHPVA